MVSSVSYYRSVNVSGLFLIVFELHRFKCWPKVVSVARQRCKPNLTLPSDRFVIIGSLRADIQEKRLIVYAGNAYSRAGVRPKPTVNGESMLMKLLKDTILSAKLTPLGM